MAKVKVNDNNNNPNGKKRATISDIANAVVESSDKMNEGLKNVVDAITKSSDKTNETLKKITKEVSDLKAKQEKSKTSKGTADKDQAEKLKADRQAAELQKLSDKHNETIANTEKLQAQTRKLEAETIKAGATTEKLRAETKQIAQEIVSTFADRKLSNEERRNKEERAQKQFELDTKEQTEKFNQKIKESDAKIEKLLSDKEISEKETNQKIANLQLDFDVKLDKYRISLEERSRLEEKRYKEQPWYSKLFGKKDTGSQEEKAKAFRESYMKNTFSDRADLKDNLSAANQAEVNSNLNWENFKPNYTTDEENQSFEERFVQQVSDLISKSTLAAQQFAQAAATQKENNEEVKKKRGRPKKSESSSSAGTKAQEETARVVNEQLDLQKSILNQLSIESKASDNILKQLAFQNAEKYKDREDKRADAQQAFDNELQSKLLKLKENESKAKTSAIESNQASKQKLDKIALDSKVLGYQIALDKYKAWQDDRAYELEKREKADKQSLRESYKESAAYRGVNAVQNAHSGFGTSVATSVALSTLTGGIINPTFIQALKLDKLITAPIEAMTKWMLSSKKKTSTTTSSAIKNSKNQPILSKMDMLGQKLDKLNKEQEVGTTEKKSKGILGKIWDGFKDIFGMVGKGLMTLLGPAALIAMLPKVKEKATELLKDFLTGKIGIGEEAAGTTSKIVTDALPGLLAGFKYGGLKGALLGGAITYGLANLDKIKAAWNKYVAKEDGDINSQIIPGIDNSTLQGVLGGATVGYLAGGLKGALFGSGIALGYQVISGIVDKWKSTADNEKGTDEARIEDLGLGEASKAVLSGALVGSPFGIKGALIGGALGLGALTISKIKEHWDQWTSQNEDGNPKQVDDIGFGTATSIVLSGAILGSTIGGIKGALIGATVGLAADIILDNVNTFKQLQNNDLSGIDRAKKTGKLILEDAIMGASLGAFGGPMGMLVGAVVGAGAGVIEGIAANWSVIKAAFTSFTDTISEAWQKVSDTYEKDGVIGIIKLIFGGIADGAEYLWNKITGSEEETNVEKSPSPAIIEARKQYLDDKTFDAEITDNGIVYKKNKIEKDEGLAKNIELTTDDSLITVANQSNDNLLKGTIFNNEKPMGLTEAISNQIGNFETIEKEEALAETGNGSGGYGKLERGKSVTGKGNPYKQDLAYRSEQYGIDTILLEDMGLHGSINNPWTSNGNSIPAISSKNKDSLQKLDKTLHDWGYDFTYTSAMGGHKFGTNHWKGNKVDLQIKTNKYPARMTPGQERALIEAGFAQNGTGAVGWEPHANQVGGGHYDLYLGDGDALENIIPNDSIGYADATNGMLEIGDMTDLGLGGFADQFVKGLDSFGSAIERLAFGNIAPSGINNNYDNQPTKLSIPSSSVSNAVQDTPKIQKNEEVPSIEMSTTNELAQLNSTLGGNKNDGSDSMKDIMTNIAANTANNANQQPVTYVNNISNSSNSQDEHVYYTGDAAKSLLFNS